MFNGVFKTPINLSWAENWAHFNTKKQQIWTLYQKTNTAKNSHEWRVFYLKKHI